ncbi:hypothetical protein PLEOSDRAFT_169993 [Pleurotus ostreatus PC15]|uniref:3'-5' exonuclease domain-containing protein n=1 Tax=Pleurotus ostreatus (strain PC15) TaxID=1137138 RepID=A0A067NE27_PLEO1|nr:hypothetical protein PLEOSDRAFT_169993 [Pleurotus ostreatus PC15]
MTTNAPLPLFTIDPNSVVVATNVPLSEGYVAKLIKDAQICPFFGFDVELTPCKEVRLVQIASRNAAYVFDIDKISYFPDVLKSFLRNDKYVKIGVGVLGDAKALLDSDEVELAGAGELSRLHRMFDLTGALSGLHFSSCVALDTLAKVWLSRGLDKALQPAHEWVGELSVEHYTYAATDAAVALAIYHRMMSVKILSNARPRLWIFSGYDACSREAVGLVKDYAPYAALSTQCITSMEGLLAKMKRRHQDADNTLPGDDFHTWTEKTIPEAVKLCASLTMAFEVYNRQMSVRKDS